MPLPQNPFAPTVYKPNISTPGKMAAPAVYQPAPPVQAKMMAARTQGFTGATAPRLYPHQSHAQAPLVYRPTVAGVTQAMPAGSAQQRPVAAPAYRPPAVVYRKPAAGPAVYRPQTEFRSASVQKMQAPPPSVASAGRVGAPAVWRPEPAKALLQTKAASKARLAPPVYAGSAAVQRCTFCGHDTCRDGEVCKADKTYGGLFHVSSTTGKVSKHKHNKSNSKLKVRESEHVLASQAIRKSIVKRRHGGKGKRPIHSTGKSYNQNEEYTISIPYAVHRGGTSGAGGGISSTGSSSTSTGWAEHVGGLLEDSPFDAIAAVVDEHLNSYFVQDKLDETVLNNLFRWIDSQVHTGRITAQEAAELKQRALNYATSLYRLQESIKNFKKGGGPGKGGGGGGLTGGILVGS